jgi:uncharacterized protein YndB with AHSA1/START domain
MKTQDPPIITTQEFNISAETLWDIITEPKHMTAWFFEQMQDFKPKAGFSTSFLIRHEGRKFTHQWTIVSVNAPNSIVYQWNYKEHKGDSTVTFTINPTSKGCHLTVTTITLEDFPQDIPEFKRESCIGGWQYFIKERLNAYVDEQITKS